MNVTPIRESTGQRIRRLREQRGISQSFLARSAKIKSPSLSEIESGKSKSPSAKTLFLLARSLGVDPYHLLTGSGPEMRTLDQLSRDEIKLIATHRGLSIPARIELEAFALQLQSAKTPEIAKPVHRVALRHSRGKRKSS